MRVSLLAARDRHRASSIPRASLDCDVADLLLRRGFEISSKRNFCLTKETRAWHSLIGPNTLDSSARELEVADIALYPLANRTRGANRAFGMFET